MKFSRKTFLRSLVVTCVAMTVPAFAQTSPAWPKQPLKLVVGFPAGTSPDLVARVISEPLSKALGQPIVVENRPGAGGNIGVDYVLRATDGHTFGITTNGPLTSSKILYSKLPYDPERDVRPLTLAASSPLVLVTSLQTPVQNMQEFIAYGKANPDAITYGSVGVGSGSHLTMELFASRAGIEALHVPFQGFPAVTNAILGGQIRASFMAPSGALAQARNGKLRILGSTSPLKSEIVPNVPTIADAGNLPGFNAELWIAAIAPKDMPQAFADRLTVEINTILKSPEARQKLFDQGWQAAGTSPEGLRSRMASDTKVWADVIQRAGVKID